MKAAQPPAGLLAVSVSIRPFLLALLCGALLALTLPRPGLCPLAWFSLAPLFGLWSDDSAPAAFYNGRRHRTPAVARSLRSAQGFATGFAAGFAFHGLALYWIYNTCRFAAVPVPAAILAWFSLAAFLALHWGIIGWAGAFSTGVLPKGLRPWAWAVLWTGLSVVWERWTPRLGADILGYTQYRHLSLLQMGSVFGPHGLGFLVAAFNAALYDAWEEAQGGKSGSAAANLALAAGLVASSWAWGLYRLAARSPGGARARVEILQPAIDQYRKWDEAFEEEIRGNFIELLSRARPENPHLIVWPESAIPRWIQEGEGVPEAGDWSRRLGAFQVVGAVSRGGGRSYNSAFLIGPDGRLQGTYHKRQLVPFGEFVPLPFLRRFIGILNELGGMTPGEPLQPLMETPLGPAGGSICYEAAFPRLARLDAGRGARLIVNVTNDGWYKDTWGPYQHFQTNVFRAVENRVTVIRAGNTGISAVIDPWGVVTAKLDLNQRGRLDAAVPLEDPFPDRSFYARHGDWFGTLCLALSLVLGVWAWRRPRP